MKFISVCSGIEAASVAWAPLGWRAAAFAEIEPFPCALLAHRFPDVPNLGDMTKFKEWPDVGAVDLLCGGTPCQSFSVAGLRGGLADPRGNLMLTFGAIAAQHRPRWLVWENVPGVLSSNGGRDFGAFLGLLGELGYGFAYRVLDAQYAGVPQRRRRVFVVGCLGDWRSAAAVLFERHSLQGHPAPRREAREETAVGVAPCLDASFGRLQGCSGQDANHGHGHLVTHSLTGEGFDASEDGTGRGTPIIPIDMRQASRGATMTNNRAEGSSGGAPGTGIGEAGDPAPTISTSHVPAIAFSRKDHGAAAGDLAPTLRAMGHSGSHANAGGQVAVAFDAYNQAASHVSHSLRAGTGSGMGDEIPQALIGSAVRRLTPRECERLQGFPDDWTLIPYRGKPAADGPRYKAIGNSWAVPCARWLGERIAAVERIKSAERVAA